MEIVEMFFEAFGIVALDSNANLVDLVNWFVRIMVCLYLVGTLIKCVFSTILIFFRRM